VAYEYLYGDDLLVAPVTEEGAGADGWSVYLPGPENWKHLWDAAGVVYEGPATIEVAAPLGLPPVFYRENSPWSALFEDIGDRYRDIE